VVSQENVDLVRGFLAGPNVDIAPLYRDDEKWAAVSARLVSAFHPDFDCWTMTFEGERSERGLGGWRKIWLEWLAPWETYRQEIEEVIDLGDQVLVLPRDFARHPGSTHEVENKTAAVFTFAAGKIARWDAYVNRSEGLKAIELEG